MRERSKVTQADIQRAIRAALAEGLPIHAVEVDAAAGMVRVLFSQGELSPAEDSERRMREAFGR